jgi:hypothetical protein
MSEPSLAIVIRTAGERTVGACHELIARQALGVPIEIVSERPFEAALARTYEIGLDLSRDWTMTLDGDVLVRKGAIDALIEAAATVPDHYAQVEGRIFDKLLGTYRHAGHRLYRTRLLERARKFIPKPGEEIRPEFSTLRKLALNGFPSRRIGAVVGIHDFEQYYGDLLRKSFVHGNKHREFAQVFVERARSHIADDADYLVLLRGYWKGLDNTGPVHIDRASMKDAPSMLAAMGLTEKPPMDADILDFDFIEAVLAGAALPDDQYPYDLNVNGEWGPEGSPATSSQAAAHQLGKSAGLLQRWVARLQSGSQKRGTKAQ